MKESSEGSRIRPACYKASPGYNATSLKDCLLTGPSLNPDLTEILIHFRRWPIALAADISKAVLQVSVTQEDRDSPHFRRWPIALAA